MNGGHPAGGRVIHTGQAIVDLVLRIPAMPEPGGDVFARAHELAAGGGFNVMAAAARDRGDVVYAGAHGTGPFADLVRAALAEEGIAVPSEAVPDLDTGFCVAAVDDDAERTFLSTLGAEGLVTAGHYDAAGAGPGDVVYVSGYSLLHERSRALLATWLPTLAEGTVVVVDPAPVIADVPDDVLEAAVGRADVWTTNEREARIVAGRRGLDPEAPTDVLAAALRDALGCDVVLRAGSDGAHLAAEGTVRHVAGYPVVEVDTNGAGDAHSGVLCAVLARGAGLAEAVRRANAAAAVAVTRYGPATSPRADELDAMLSD